MNEIERTTYNAPDLAQALGISRTAAYNLMNRADFPSFRSGCKRLLVRISDVDKWIDERISEEQLRKDKRNEHHKRLGLRTVASGSDGRRVPGSGPGLVQARRAVCERCGRLWGVSARVQEDGYICPDCMGRRNEKPEPKEKAAQDGSPDSGTVK